MQAFEICVLTVDNNYQSIFTVQCLRSLEHQGMHISERQPALNFRHRSSQPGYTSDWHVAGDPTLIIVRQGQLALELRSGEKRTFTAGEQFIAADYLPANTVFAAEYGHRASVESEQTLLAVHIKLSDNPAQWHQQLNAL